MKIIYTPNPVRVPQTPPSGEAAAAPTPAPPPPTVSLPLDREAEQRAAEREQEIQHTLDVFKAQIGTLHEELEQLNAAREKEELERQRDARTIQALSDEIASLRKAVLEPRKAPDVPIDTAPAKIQFIEVSPKPIPAPASSPAASSRGSTVDSPLTTAGNDVHPAPALELKPEPSREWLDALTQSAPTAARDKPLQNIDLPSEKNEGKVALLSKLWDYLNRTAVEIPLRKPDQND